MSIPKVIHRVHLGASPISEESIRFEETFRQLNPTRKVMLWTDAEVSALPNHRLLNDAVTISGRSNIARIDLVRLMGGIYVDTDVERLQRLDILLTCGEAFVGQERGRLVGNAVFGAIPNHPYVTAMAEAMPDWAGRRPPWGPRMFTHFLFAHRIRILPRKVFYPWLWHRKQTPRHKLPRESLTTHYWRASWRSEIRSPESLGRPETSSEFVPKPA